MSAQLNIQNLIKAINESETDIIINEYIQAISKDITEATKCTSFFNLPLTILSSIVKTIDFAAENKPNILLKTIIAGATKFHKEKAILLLNDFTLEKMPEFTMSEVIEIVSQFKSSEILTHLGKLYEEYVKQPELDYEWEIEQLKIAITKKDEQIAQLKPKIDQPPVLKTDLTSNNTNDNKSGKTCSWTLLHHACLTGKYNLLKFICGRQNTNINVKDDNGRTPLFYACKGGYLEIVKYLCETQDVNTEGVYSSATPNVQEYLRTIGVTN